MSSSPLFISQRLTPATLCPQIELDQTSILGPKKPVGLDRFSALPKLAGVVPASRLHIRPAPERVSSGIHEIDSLTGGLPRGCLTEVCGSASSGRTSLLLSLLASSTGRGEVCALVDVSDALDPASARAAGVVFEKLLWVRCGKASPHASLPAKSFERQKEDPVEQALRVTDLLLQSGGFGLVIIDLGDIAMKAVRRIPLTSWFRFQRAVENTATVLLVIAPVPCAPACAALLLKLRASGKKLSAVHPQLSEQSHPSHSRLFNGLLVEGEVLRSRERKPMQSVVTFATRAARAG